MWQLALSTKSPDVIEELCRGGWPEHLGLSVRSAQRRLRSYLSEIARLDIAQAEGAFKRSDTQKVERSLLSFARNTATTASLG